MGDSHGDGQQVLLHCLRPAVNPADRFQVLRRKLGRQGGRLGQLVGEGVPPPMQPGDSSLHRSRLIKVRLHLDGGYAPVSNQRPKDPPSMAVRTMLVGRTLLDPQNYCGIVDDHCGVADSAKEGPSGHRRQLC